MQIRTGLQSSALDFGQDDDIAEHVILADDKFIS